MSKCAFPDVELRFELRRTRTKLPLITTQLEPNLIKHLHVCVISTYDHTTLMSAPVC